MKKIFFLLILTCFLTPLVLFAANYTPLAPIDGYVTDSTTKAGLEAYIANMYRLGVGIATLLAVLMVIWGGVEYMTTDAWGHKEEGKERIQAALFGLMLALGSYIIITTIDSSILNIDFNVLENNKLKVSDQFSLRVPGTVYEIQTGADGNEQVINNPNGINVVPDGNPYNPKLTAYSPQEEYDEVEGGYASSRPGLDGKAVVRTLDDVVSGDSKYVTLAGDPSQYGKKYIIPSITYKDSSGNTKTVKNVLGYVHDTGSAFTGAGTNKYDVAIGRDYDVSIINDQPFNAGGTSIIPGKNKP